MLTGNIEDLKETLTAFKQHLEENIKTDDQYEGEADELLTKLDSVQKTMKNIKTMEEFDALLGAFGRDFLYVVFAIQQMNDMDDDFEFDDEDLFEDEEEEEAEETK